jgi:hypothetical protein
VWSTGDEKSQALSAARPATQVNHRKTQKNMILRFLSTIEQLHHFSYISASLRSKRYEKKMSPRVCNFG